MSIILIVLIPVLVTIVFILVMTSLVSLSVYGRLISDSRLESLFNDVRVSDYRLNRYSDKIIWAKVTSHNFIAITGLNLMGKYYINDIGTIPRWSKWTKIIDEHRRDLLERKGK